MQKKKILFILALICAVVQGAWAQADDNWENVPKTRPPLYSNYRGITNVFVVSTPQHLAWISENIDETLYFTNGDYDVDEQNIYLLNDINLTSICDNWLPIGREDITVTKFKCTFYGNGHTITFNIKKDDNWENMGLIATVGKDAKVQDLNVVCNISSENDYVGGICGENYGTIQNCSVTGSIKGTETQVGGIVGRNYGYGKILDCRVDATVEGDDEYVGGIAARNDYECEIKNCRVSGTIKSSHVWVGGIAGMSAGTVENCWVSADVSSTYDGRYYVGLGGIVGYVPENGTVKYCCMTGNVNSNQQSVGGIAGLLEQNCTISHCTFYGTSSGVGSLNKFVGQWNVSAGSN